MSKYDLMTDEQWRAEFDAFWSKHKPPRPKSIQCLNLIMRKVNALDIVRGTKKVEIRSFSDHYYKRLVDKECQQWYETHRNDKDMDAEACDEFTSSIRPVYKIHFHDYNNSWFLDVECTENSFLAMTEENLASLEERFGFTDLYESLEAIKIEDDDDIEERPFFYYFAIGKIIDTNLDNQKRNTTKSLPPKTSIKAKKRRYTDAELEARRASDRRIGIYNPETGEFETFVFNKEGEIIEDHL